MTQDCDASKGAMAAPWSRGVNVGVRTRCEPPIPSCLGIGGRLHVAYACVSL